MCGWYRFHFGAEFPFLKTGSLWTQAALPPTQSDAHHQIDVLLAPPTPQLPSIGRPPGASTQGQPASVVGLN